MRDGNEFFIYKLGSRWTHPPQSVDKEEWPSLVAPSGHKAHAPAIVYGTLGRWWTPQIRVKDWKPPSARGASSEVYFSYWHGHVQQARAKMTSWMLSRSTGAGTQ